jgi:regulator of replication initiation timing
MFFKKEETEEIKNFYEQCQQDFINRTHNAIVSLVEENKLLKDENEILKNGAYFYTTPRGYGKTVAEENFRLKSVLKEIREYIKENIKEDREYERYMGMRKEKYNELLEIIDKGIGE